MARGCRARRRLQGVDLTSASLSALRGQAVMFVSRSGVCFQNDFCSCPHSLQMNGTRSCPDTAEIRLTAPHFPHRASIRVSPFLMVMDLRSVASFTSRSDCSRISCFDISSRFTNSPAHDVSSILILQDPVINRTPSSTAEASDAKWPACHRLPINHARANPESVNGPVCGHARASRRKSSALPFMCGRIASSERLVLRSFRPVRHYIRFGNQCAAREHQPSINALYPNMIRHLMDIQQRLGLPRTIRAQRQVGNYCTPKEFHQDDPYWRLR
jgi:hypothetical protein